MDRFSRGSYLCCESTSYSDMIQGNTRFWAKKNVDMGTKIDEKASEFG